MNPNYQMMQQQINPQRQQLSPSGKSQIKTENIFQVGSSKNSNQFPFFRGKQKNPNVDTETDDSNNKNYDDSDGYQDGDYHDDDQDNNQLISNDYWDDNQSGESVNDDNQPDSDYQGCLDDNEPDQVGDDVQDY